MNILKTIKKILSILLNSKQNNIMSSEAAYDLWANSYGKGKNNLTLHYDNIILKELVSKLQLGGKIVFDYGCGTGRNWNLILDKNPAKVIGCDISQNMLAQLKKKYSNAEVYKTNNYELSFLQDNSCDIIISTLVIAHISNIKKLFDEWNRVLKNKSDIIITDFHPDLLAKGGNRTFNSDKELITIENYCHSIKTIEEYLSEYGFTVSKLIEKNIDDNVKSFYKKRDAIKVYNKFYNTPFIYGLHLSR